ALQRAGIAAAPMLRVGDLPDSAYCRARGAYRTDVHPHLVEPVISERRTAAFADAPDPAARPAPLIGEQTREVVAEWLGLDADAIAALVESGTLQPTEASVFAAIDAHRGTATGS
ncbi:MAG: CoA transferase, partial [Sphingopyxis sp.]